MKLSTMNRRHLGIALCLVGLRLALFSPPEARAADSPAAEIAYKAATNAYHDKFFDRAERELGEFVAHFPDSTKLAEAVLIQAQSRFELKNYNGVIELLNSRLTTAGPLEDQYRYLIAEAHYQNNTFHKAASVYADLLKDFPESPLRLRASYAQALALFRTNEFAQTIELLKTPAGAFQQTARSSTNEEDIVKGYLLLGEAYFEQKNYASAEETLNQLESRKLNPDLEWRRQYSLANTLLANQKPDAALQRVTNLVASVRAATNTLPNNAVLLLNSLMLQAAILETKQQTNAAIEVYEQISPIKGIPLVQTRQAVIRSVELMVAQNRLTNAIQRLESYLEQNKQDADPDLIRLTLGKLYLKQYSALSEKYPRADLKGMLPLATNLLQRARTNFDAIVYAMTNSPLLGKAYLQRGWCLFEEGTLTQVPAKILESRKAFQTAIEQLPVSEDQALARFKLADGYFEQKDYTNAIRNYRLLVESYADVAAVRAEYADRALSHMIQASLELKDFKGAKASLDKLLGSFPKSSWSEQSLFLYGQTLLNQGQAAEARAALSDFQKRYAQAALLPEVRLAIAHSYADEANWVLAIKEYEAWIAAFTNHVARPQAEFERAWVYDQSGQETNALPLFTNLVARFASNAMAPLAQYWVGNYYFNRREYLNAEGNYQLLFQTTNFPPSEFTYRAQLMAGKSAFLRDAASQARKYLVALINQPDCPRPIEAETYLMLGAVLVKESPTNYADAIIVLGRIPRNFPNTPWEPLAHGELAKCQFMLAATEPGRYTEATNECFQVLTNSLSNVASRSEAQTLLAEIHVKLADLKPAPEQKELLNRAWNYYLDVIYGKGNVLRPGENPDPFWVQKAGQAAARLAEERLRRVPDAIQIYARLKIEVPALTAVWQKRIDELNRGMGN
jgi:TolA-binding protein